jgi:hypothetical protein
LREDSTTTTVEIDHGIRGPGRRQGRGFVVPASGKLARIKLAILANYFSAQIIGDRRTPISSQVLLFLSLL